MNLAICSEADRVFILIPEPGRSVRKCRSSIHVFHVKDAEFIPENYIKILNTTAAPFVVVEGVLGKLPKRRSIPDQQTITSTSQSTYSTEQKFPKTTWSVMKG
jgi:hypothetical protein